MPWCRILDMRLFCTCGEVELQLAESCADELRRLDHRARVVLSLFNQADQITTAQVAEVLGLSARTHAVQCSRGACVAARMGGRRLA